MFCDVRTSSEERLFQAISCNDSRTVLSALSQGADPNKIVSSGKTSLGEAARIGNSDIVQLLVHHTLIHVSKHKNNVSPYSKKLCFKSHKRKQRQELSRNEHIAKNKNIKDKTSSGTETLNEKSDSRSIVDNQGYFVFVHSDGSSSDESKISNLLSPLSPSATPQFDLEWDEDIVNVAPPTNEDEAWTSIYKWYAAILESTGAALASASTITNGLDQQDVFMRTALHYASEQGNYSAVKLLLEAGCKVDIATGDGLTALHVATIKNHSKIAKLLIQSGSYVNCKTHERMTPLHFAASRGFTHLVETLVSGGAFLEARDNNERTPLYLASGRGHTDTVKFLIASGANVNGEEIHGYTPLCESVWQRCEPVVDILLKSGARVIHSHRLLHNAVIQRQEGIVKLLADSCGGLALHEDHGDTPLLLAARLSHQSIVLTLLQKGANVNAVNNITGVNALHIAVENVDCPVVFEEMLLYLLEYKIDMNSIALTGDTALNRALLLHKDQAAMLLIQHGADVNACDPYACGLDNLSIASSRDSTSLSSMLIKAGHHVVLPDSSESVPKQSTAFWVYQTSKQPLSLVDLCRICVRRSCTNGVLYHFIQSLNLPKSIKQFLMMKNELL